MEKTLPPVNVSPLIKTGRWSLLIAGIIYGAVHHSRLSKKEMKRFLELEKTRPEREARKAAEKERIAKENLEILKQQLGSPLE